MCMHRRAWAERPHLLGVGNTRSVAANRVSERRTWGALGFAVVQVRAARASAGSARPTSLKPSHSGVLPAGRWL